ncbi:2-polyprenyl-3-methyl-6-methoxy-1,4-benzoquinone monooxygenase [Propionivibrio sp.]|uniref:2-polyprenyl-3-methyl-6-methoxy-1,4-benzoquinone monooxygenase n=1 Tax=Propionivibrio sp. TaxID=2212460 RepID=UPI003BF22D59
MLDPIILGFDRALRTLFSAASTTRSMPGGECVEPELSAEDRAHAGALMRINHVGEVCAQALYQGQALICHDPEIRQAMNKAAYEETEHLDWTARRINELDARKSLLNPLWYLGALSLGVFAGKLGDAWSLGFLAETERQVETHLDHHLSELPTEDVKSLAIVLQMKIDEKSHAEMAVRLGARELPTIVKKTMRLMAGVMTRTSYYL